MGEKLELRLKSPVGAEPAVYPWPLPVYVSTAPPLPLPAVPPPGSLPPRGARWAHRATEQLDSKITPGDPPESPLPFLILARRVGSGEPGLGADAATGTPRFGGAPEPRLPLLVRGWDPRSLPAPPAPQGGG